MERTALITGAMGGIGTALCEVFTRAGYRVFATDRKQGNCACADFLCGDVRDFCDSNKHLEAFVRRCTEFCGESGLQALVNNAAIQILNHVEEIDRSQWQETLDTNLLAPFFLTQALLPLLTQGHGAVVNIASVHALTTKPRFVAYATSKAAVVGLTRAMAVDLGPRVRVNAINPSATATPMLLAGFEGFPEKLEELAAKHPLHRIAFPEEIAQAALFLASDAASFTSGATLSLDGGISARLNDPD